MLWQSGTAQASSDRSELSEHPHYSTSAHQQFPHNTIYSQQTPHQHLAGTNTAQDPAIQSNSPLSHAK